MGLGWRETVCFSSPECLLYGTLGVDASLHKLTHTHTHTHSLTLTHAHRLFLLARMPFLRCSWLSALYPSSLSATPPLPLFGWPLTTLAPLRFILVAAFVFFDVVSPVNVLDDCAFDDVFFCVFPPLNLLLPLALPALPP